MDTSGQCAAVNRAATCSWVNTSLLNRHPERESTTQKQPRVDNLGTLNYVVRVQQISESRAPATMTDKGYQSLNLKATTSLCRNLIVACPPEKLDGGGQFHTPEPHAHLCVSHKGYGSLSTDVSHFSQLQPMLAHDKSDSSDRHPSPDRSLDRAEASSSGELDADVDSNPENSATVDIHPPDVDPRKDGCDDQSQINLGRCCCRKWTYGSVTGDSEQKHPLEVVNSSPNGTLILSSVENLTNSTQSSFLTTNSSSRKHRHLVLLPDRISSGNQKWTNSVYDSKNEAMKSLVRQNFSFEAFESRARLARKCQLWSGVRSRNILSKGDFIYQKRKAKKTSKRSYFGAAKRHVLITFKTVSKSREIHPENGSFSKINSEAMQFQVHPLSKRWVATSTRCGLDCCDTVDARKSDTTIKNYWLNLRPRSAVIDALLPSYSFVSLNSRKIIKNKDQCGRGSLHLGQLELLPLVNLNVNCNAGCSDPPALIPASEEIEQTSQTSVLSAEQYFSTRVDTEVSTPESEQDNSLSPSPASGGDDVVTVITHNNETNLNPGLQNSLLENTTKASETPSLKPSVCLVEALPKVQTISTQDQAVSEKTQDLPAEKNATKSVAGLSVNPKEVVNPVTLNRNKKVAPGNRNEANFPKKSPGSAAARGAMRTAFNSNRQLPERQKPTALGDHQKHAYNPGEKWNRSVADTSRPCKVATKASEGHWDNSLETKLKHKPAYEAYLEYVYMKDAHRPIRATQVANTEGLGVRSAESEHRYNHFKHSSRSSAHTEITNQMKRLVSLPETAPTQPLSITQLTPVTPTPTGVEPNCTEDSTVTNVPVLLELEDSLEKKAPASPRKSPASSVSPSPTRLRILASAESIVAKDISNKPDFQRRTRASKSPKSPMKVAKSPRKTLNGSSDTDLTSLKDNKETTEQALGGTETTPLVQTDLQVEMFAEVNACISSQSPKLDQVVQTKRYCSPSPMGRDTGPQTKLNSQKVKAQNLKVKLTDNENENIEGTEIKTKIAALKTSPIGKKKRLKVQSNSPDNSKKRKPTRRSASDSEDVRVDKNRKHKSGERVTDKKKKKKKLKTKVDMAEAGGRKPKLFRKTDIQFHAASTDSSIEFQKCDNPNVLEASTTKIASNTSLSSASHVSRGKLVKVSVSKRENMSNEQLRMACNDGEPGKNGEEQIISPFPDSPHLTNDSGNFDSNAPIKSNLDSPFYFTHTPKTLTRCLNSSSTQKSKKNEKDLQEAELGWNSTFNTDEKGSAEKFKNSTKRPMVRYYIVKPKPKKNEKEVASTSKLKRPASRYNPADELDVYKDSETDFSGDAVPLERVRLGQGKSVQFSDNIEDLEASKEDANNERNLRRPDCELLLHPASKVASDTLKPSSKILDLDLVTVAGKSVNRKMDEIRPQATPPIKKRPVWLKKSTKDKQDKTSANVKVSAPTKPQPILQPVKQHSSDSLTKSSVRVHLHYQATQPLKCSPEISNICLNDKRKVAYNSWISNVLTAGPMNKATRKAVAKGGSPVDIKEIIEGSSVDAADHLRAVKLVHDGTVRAARSVPSLAPIKLTTNSGKKIVFVDDSKVGTSKKVGGCKIMESWSPQIRSLKDGPTSRSIPSPSTVLTSPSFSTNVDQILPVSKPKVSRDKKAGKKIPSPRGWHVSAHKDGRKISDMESYSGDAVDLNVLNMGLTWVMQSVVNKLPFLHSRQSTDSMLAGAIDIRSDGQLWTRESIV